ncbi:MAG: hypothetical protein IJI25_01290 [Eubacterium sp.]|nr:hypothetical protein [Eubacterium sp.]
MSTIIGYVSDQIVLRYMDACKTATVLFSGALIGYGEAVKALKELKDNGWKLTAVLSRAAGEVLTEERIRNDIDPEAVFVEGAPINGRQIIDDNQYVIIPELTINTAAKVANCISDNLLTNMISRAMATGKPVIASIDGCCPDSEIRAKLGFKVTESYKARMRRNLEDLQSYGIVLTVNSNLCSKVTKIYESSFDFSREDIERKASGGNMPKEDTAPEKCVLKSQEAGESIVIDKNVISRTDIARYSGLSRIVVSKGTVVTDLASDEARRRGIEIIRE